VCAAVHSAVLPVFGAGRAVRREIRQGRADPLIKLAEIAIMAVGAVGFCSITCR
jgi:hypothetical protein